MKKKIGIVSILLAVCLGLILIGVNKYHNDGKEVILIPAIHADSSFDVKTLQDVEKNSDLIVQATILPDSKNRTFESSSGLTVYGITYTTLDIRKVLYGEAKVGDQVKITEEYYYVDDPKFRNVYYTGNYAPSTAGQEYIFFLSKYPKSDSEYYGLYFPKGIEYGRYPVIDKIKQGYLEGKKSEYFNVDMFTNSDLNLGNEDSAVYRSFFEEVIEKYYGL